jgi:hypothetical protein
MTSGCDLPHINKLCIEGLVYIKARKLKYVLISMLIYYELILELT